MIPFVPVVASEGIMAGVPIDWDDPMAVGCQTNHPHNGPWCPTCMTGNQWTRVPFLGFAAVNLDVCWWCCGPMVPEKPTRTVQTTDTTVANTRLEPTAGERNEWEAVVAAELARIYGEHVA